MNYISCKKPGESFCEDNKEICFLQAYNMLYISILLIMLISHTMFKHLFVSGSLFIDVLNTKTKL